MKRTAGAGGDAGDGMPLRKKHKLKRGRVTCPIDSSHTVSEKKLRQHLAKCEVGGGPLPVAEHTPAMQCDVVAAWQAYADQERLSFLAGGDGMEALLAQGCSPNAVKKTGVALPGASLTCYQHARDVPDALCAQMELKVAQACVVATARLRGAHVEGPSTTSCESLQEWWCQQQEQTSIASVAPVADASDPAHTGVEHKTCEDRQLTGLLEMMRTRGLLAQEEKVCFVEFGAGKGTLSLALQRATEGKSSHLLLDRCTFKHKARLDKSAGMEHRASVAQAGVLSVPSSAIGRHLLPEVHRVTASIESLLLAGFPPFSAVSVHRKADSTVEIGRAVSESKGIVGVGKHVCGIALDHSLRALAKAAPQVQGLAMATCCHYLSSAALSVATPFLAKELQLSWSEVDLLAVFSHWATLKVPEGDSDASKGKRRFGRQCKFLFDVGRVLYVREHIGLASAELVRYCLDSVTVENALIIASHP